MSTNYYLKRIPTEDEIAQCHKQLDERKIEYCDVYDEEYGTPYLTNFLDTMTKQIHIGKFSDGWRFLFRSHTDLYAKNIQSCLDYLQSQLNTDLWRVIDEYGETIPVLELEKRIRKSLDGITLREYYQKYPERGQMNAVDPQQELSSDGSRWWDEDFW